MLLVGLRVYIKSGQRDSLHPEPKPKLVIELFCVLMTKWKELARLAG